jgi:hypothetical protein
LSQNGGGGDAGQRLETLDEQHLGIPRVVQHDNVAAPRIAQLIHQPVDNDPILLECPSWLPVASASSAIRQLIFVRSSLWMAT